MAVFDGTIDDDVFTGPAWAHRMSGAGDNDTAGSPVPDILQVSQDISSSPVLDLTGSNDCAALICGVAARPQTALAHHP